MTLHTLALPRPQTRLTGLLPVFLLLALVFSAAPASGDTITYPGYPLTNPDPIFGQPNSLVPTSPSGNTVTVTGGAPIAGNAYGGASATADAFGNTFLMQGGQINQNLYGGGSLLGNVYNNTVRVTGGTIVTPPSGALSVSGGYSSQGKVYGNTLIIDNGAIGGNTHGGLGEMGDVYGNTLIINGGVIAGTAYGGFINPIPANFGRVYGNRTMINNGSSPLPLPGGAAISRGTYSTTAITFTVAMALPETLLTTQSPSTAAV